VVDVLVILDGASEPLGDGPTSLELARTPCLDGLARLGAAARWRTVPDGLPPGSEHAIPTLLGWPPSARVDRGALEAAARGIALDRRERAWRVDCPDRGSERRAAAVAGRLAARLPRHRVTRIGGHRLLVCGPAPLPPFPPVPGGLRAWPEGVVPPALLDESCVMIAAAGAAAGVARLMGARVVVRPDADQRAKAAAAEAARGATRVVVHVGAPDEAAHDRDRAKKVRAIERADRELIGPLERLVAERGGTLTVCPDHGCDPSTGDHDAAPVPVVRWAPAGRAGSGTRLTERAVAGMPVTEPAVLRLEEVPA